MLTRIGKLPRVKKAKQYSWGSLMQTAAKNEGLYDTATNLLYNTGTILNQIDSNKYNDNPARIAGVGYYTDTASPQFAPLMASNKLFSIAAEKYKDKGTEDKEEVLQQPLVTLESLPSWDFRSSIDPNYDWNNNGHSHDAGGALAAGLTAAKLGADAFANYASKSSIKDTSGIKQGVAGLASTKFSGSNEDLLDTYSRLNKFNPISYRNLLKGSSGFTVGDAFQGLGAGLEGAKAGAAFGGYGAAAGAAVGIGSSLASSIFGRGKAKRRAKRQAASINEAGLAANALAENNFISAVDFNDFNLYRNSFNIFSSMNTGTSGVNAALGGYLFDIGGPVGNHGAVWDLGLNYFDVGGSHEENPNEGILQGVAPDGQPNLVEEGEYKWEDPTGEFGTYIFSNRLKVPNDFLKQYKLGKDKTFAEAVQMYIKKYGTEDTENDPIAQDSINDFLKKLATIQEEQRIQEQIKEVVEQLQNMSPEEQQQFLANMAMMQQQQAAAQDLAMQELMAQQQLGQPQLMLELMPPEEAAMMQEPQPELVVPQEQVPVEEQPPMEEELQPVEQPMMSRGGALNTPHSPQYYNNPKALGELFRGLSSLLNNQYAEGGEFTNAELANAIADESNNEELRQAATQQQAELAQEQEEQLDESQLDDLIDLIVAYARETGNKELLAGARAAYRGSAEEKKAFIERANQLIETELAQQEQQMLEQGQAQQLAEAMQQELQLPQQPSPEEAAAMGEGNQFAWGGTLTSPQKERLKAQRIKEDAFKDIITSLGVDNFNTNLEGQFDALLKSAISVNRISKHQRYSDSDKTALLQNRYDYYLKNPREEAITGKRNIEAVRKALPRIKSYNELKKSLGEPITVKDYKDIQDRFKDIIFDENNKDHKDKLKAFTESEENGYREPTKETNPNAGVFKKGLEGLDELTNLYLTKLTDFYNRHNIQLDKAISKRYLTGDQARQFVKELQGTGYPKDAALAEAIMETWGDPTTMKWTTPAGDWKFNNPLDSGDIEESEKYRKFVDKLNIPQGQKDLMLDHKMGIAHVPLLSFIDDTINNPGQKQAFYVIDDNNKVRQLMIDPNSDLYALYFEELDGNESLPDGHVRLTSSDNYNIQNRYYRFKPIINNYLEALDPITGQEVIFNITDPTGMDSIEGDTDRSKPILLGNSGYAVTNNYYKLKGTDEDSEGSKHDSKDILEGIKGLGDVFNWRALPLFLYQLNHKPNNSYMEAALNGYNNVRDVVYTPYSSYVNPTYMDINIANNKARDVAARSIAASRDASNGNSAIYNNNALIGNYTYQLGLADNLVKGILQNGQQAMAAGEHNIKAPADNAKNYLSASSSNSARDLEIAKGRVPIYKELGENEASYHQGIAQGLGTLLNVNPNASYNREFLAYMKDLLNREREEYLGE